MTQQNQVEEKSCVIPSFERNRYFFGKPMTVRDFEAEQQYLIGKSRLQHRLIHGSGIICGLVPSDAKLIGSKVTVVLSDGAALDCCGNLIVVNKSDPIEVLADYDPADGLHYLYLRYSECVRQPIRASANVSGCEEVCCYNRIRETFEVVLSEDAPNGGGPAFTGLVTAGDRRLAGARVRAFRSAAGAPAAVEAETVTEPTGQFSLNVPAGVDFDVVASATGYSPKTISSKITPSDKHEKDLGEFKLTALSSPVAPADICANLTQDYFEGHAGRYRQCDDPKVFLAAVKISGGKWIIDPKSIETRRNRAVVYTNPMLHDLFCDHVTDFSNPHRTSAAQVKALQNINGVGNSDESDKVVPGIEIVGETGGTITIDNNQIANRITISGPHPATALPKSVSTSPQVGTEARFAREDHEHDLKERVVEIKHLSDEALKNLLFSPDSSITVAVNKSANRRIDLSTVPATEVSSVGTQKRVGTLLNFARQDHVHDLDTKIVERKHLSEDTFAKLIGSSDGSIKVTVKNPGTLNERQIDVTAKMPAPATDPNSVSSVSARKALGTSPNFARQDHVHNFSINEKGPDSSGNFRLKQGKNITIESDKDDDNALVISASAGQAVTNVSSKVTTGLVVFPQVTPQATMESPRINHGLEAHNFAIVLSLVTPKGLAIGDLSVLDSSFDQNNPRFAALYTEGSDSFQIILRDTRTKTDQPTTSYALRWWAIPSTNEIPTSGSKEDPELSPKDASGSTAEVLTEIKSPSA